MIQRLVRALKFPKGYPGVNKKAALAAFLLFTGITQEAAMSLSFVSGMTRTFTLFGRATTSMVSPGRKGFGTFFYALRAGTFTVLTLSKPGNVKLPTARFLM